MKLAGNRFAAAFLAALALAALTACGGGSSMTTVAGTTVTAAFKGSTMPSAVAYQTGTTGTFQTLAFSGSSVSFTVPTGTTAYGFAYQCPGGGSSFPQESIIQATTTDTTSLSFACPPPASGKVIATFNVSAIPGATGIALWGGNGGSWVSGTVGTVNLSEAPLGTSDIALVATDASGSLAVQIQRGVNVTSSTSIAFPPMTSANELGTAQASVTGAPSSNGGAFTAYYNTVGGLSFPLTMPLNAFPQTTYATVPSGQAQTGDFYLLNGYSGPIANSTESVGAVVTANTASAISLALPPVSTSLNPPTPAAFPKFYANTSGFPVAGPVVDASQIVFQINPNNGNSSYEISTYVTKTWLGANTTFATPDLSGLIGFAPAPPAGVNVNWNFYSVAGTPLQFSSVGPAVFATFTSPTSLQYINTFGGFTVP
ncbi:MAG: hypothetical protein ACYDC6_04285 [Acidobacteriaceae bacterium]